MGTFRGHTVLFGADVSAYDPNMNFGAFKNGGYSFVIIKSTEGADYKSPAWSSWNYPGKARAAGVTYGAYHYAHPGNAVAQARFMLAVTGRHAGDMLRPTLDIEGGEWNSSNAPAFARAFSAEIKRQIGVAPIVYCSASFWGNQLRGGSGWRAGEPLWVAHYTSANNPAVSGWDIWQHSESWPVPGNRKGDANVSRGTDLSKLTVASGPAYRTRFGLDTTSFLGPGGKWIGRAPVYGVKRPYAMPGFSDLRRVPANRFPLLRPGSTGSQKPFLTFLWDLLTILPGGDGLYAKLKTAPANKEYYGSEMYAAVYEYQRTHDLGTNSGAMTEATWASLLDQVKV